MANLTAPVVASFQQRKLSAYDMKRGGAAKAAQTLWKGCMVGFDATLGTVIRGGGVIATFNGHIQGVFRGYGAGQLQSFGTTATVGGELVEFECGIFRMKNIGAITIASRGKLCFADDDQSVSLTNTNVTAGIIEDVDALGVWVAIGMGLDVL